MRNLVIGFIASSLALTGCSKPKPPRPVAAAGPATVRPHETVVELRTDPRASKSGAAQKLLAKAMTRI